jgi:hypothetical protein
MPKQIFIRGKSTSLERARRITKQAYGSNNFEARYKRGEVQLYFPNYISAKEVEIIAKELRLKVISLGTKAILDVD